MPQTEESLIQILPYSMLVGQGQMKKALALAFVAPRLEGVLLSGTRGTGKSTAVRAFAMMAYGRLPVTLPINATEDRVVGGLQIDELLQGRRVPQPGLLEAANGGLLYIDEVNLLDDHIVNLILDVTSSNRLVVEREGLNIDKEVRFTLIGTMNPAEGGLRPQLLDRFALMVNVAGEPDPTIRTAILDAVLTYDTARALETAKLTGAARTAVEGKRYEDATQRDKLYAARDRFHEIDLSPKMAELCVAVGQWVAAEGHRGDYVLALAARANAALRGASAVAPEDLIEVAPLALQHRRAGVLEGGEDLWTPTDHDAVARIVRGESPVATESGIGVEKSPSSERLHA